MYDAVADLPLTVESVELERVERETPAFARATTIVTFRGDGETGRGEDVTYEMDHHDALEAWWDERGDDAFDLAGEYTFAEFSQALDDTDLWPTGGPERDDFRDYRRWGSRPPPSTWRSVRLTRRSPTAWTARWTPCASSSAADSPRATRPGWRRCSSATPAPN